MNSNKNKAELWDQCVQGGLFLHISKDSSTKIQNLFESIVERYSLKTDPLELLNKQFIVSFKEELGKLNSFEERQKEYDEMLKTTPQPIDFSEKKDEPLENIDLLVEKTQSIRQQPIELPQMNWGQIIKTQNDILVQILQTQIKIINLLQKK